MSEKISLDSSVVNTIINIVVSLRLCVMSIQLRRGI